jgi:hypothetical protein
MRMKLAVPPVGIVLGLALLLTSAQALAHHAFAAEFDVNRPLTLKGSLLKWDMVNPHSWFHITVKEKDGKTTTWLVEGGSPNQLIRMVVEGYQAKDGTNKAVGRNFVLADGKRLFLGGSAGGVSDPAKVK